MSFKKRFFLLVSAVWIVLAQTSCTKVLAVAKDYPTEVVSRTYTRTPDQMYHQSLSILDKLGYEVVSSDPYQYQITTGWKSTTSGSHYLEVFERRDDSANAGAFYNLVLNFVPQGGHTRVDVRTTVKALSGKLLSAKVLEKKFFARLDDATRSPNFQVTNVGFGELVTAPAAPAQPVSAKQTVAPAPVAPAPAQPAPTPGRYVDPTQPVQPLP